MRRQPKAIHLRSRLFLTAAFCLPLLLAGCVQIEQILELNADGSGTLNLSYVMTEEKAAEMQALADSMSSDTNQHFSLDFNDDDIREDFKEFEPYGVVLSNVKTETVDGKKSRHFEITFKSLEGLSRSGFMADRDISLEKNAEGNYVLTEAGEAPAEEAPMDPLTAKLMEGFGATIEIRTPGKVLNTSAPEKTDRSAIWRFDLTKDPTAVNKLQRVRLMVTFDGAGLDLPEYRSGRTSK